MKQGFLTLDSGSKLTTTRDLRVFLGIWAGIFGVFVLSGVVLHDTYRIWAICGLLLALLLWLYPRASMPLYIAQVKLGSVLGWCISRATLLVLFVAVFCPVGLLFRLFKRDVLAPRYDKAADSYLIVRESQPASMRNQF